jgi:hypothetical protein
MPNTSFKLTGLGNTWKRRAIAWGVVAVVLLVAFLMTWNTFFIYVPPQHHLVITAKAGNPLPPGHVLAEKGEMGIQREVLGEGWHFVLPIVYGTEAEENTAIPAGKVGIVRARGGEPLPPGQVLADEGQQGIQRHILPPGAYRINKHGFDVELVDAVEIKPGFVGVQQRLLGTDGQGLFAEKPGEKGVLREVLQPGLYYVNTKEYKVIPAEVGIIQTTFHKNPKTTKGNKEEDPPITFTAKGGMSISMDCTIEWEVMPEDMPALVAKYGSWEFVEKNVLKPQARAIGRDKGINYGVQDFLEGFTREKFQDDFTKELVQVCKEKNVTVHSAFIRQIEIPDIYMKPIREKQIAEETKRTNTVQEAAARSDAEVKREEEMVNQKVQEVKYETKRLVATIDTEVENIGTRTDTEIEKLKADYQNKIAAITAEQKTLLAKAESEVGTLKKTAEGNLYQLKMEVFQNDGNAFLRYALAEQLNPNLVLRLFHSGPGTFWTNMDGKGMNFMMPLPGTTPKMGPPAPAGKTATNR